MDYKAEYEYYKRLYEDILNDVEIIEKENKLLTEEVTKQKRKVAGLEQQVKNLKEKNEKVRKWLAFSE